MNEELDKRAVSDGERILSYLEKQIPRMVAPILQKDKQRAELRKKLFDDQLRGEIIPPFGPVEIIEKIDLDYKDNNKFIDEIKKMLPEIKKSALRLAQLIESLIKPQSDLPLLGRIASLFHGHTSEQVYYHIKEHSKWYFKNLNLLKGKETVEKLIETIRIFMLSSGKIKQRMQVIQRYGEEVKKWDLRNMNSSMCIDLIRKSVGELQQLKDQKINALTENPEVKALIVHNNELSLLKDIEYRIALALGREEGTWKHFLAVFSGMKGIIRAIEERYYDPELANELRGCLRDNERYGQEPEPWKRKFEEIIARKSNELEIMQNSQRVILKLFSDVIMRIKEIDEEVFKHAQRDVEKIISGRKKTPRKTRKIILDNTKRLKKASKNRLEKIRSDYDNLESSNSNLAREFYQMLADLNKINVDSFVKDIIKVESRKPELYKRGLQVLAYSNFENDADKIINNLLKMFSYENGLYRIYEKSKDRATQTFYKDFPSLIFKLNKVVKEFEKGLDLMIIELNKIVYENTQMKNKRLA